MYTILVKRDDTLVATTKENIMHRTSLVKKLRFLVDPLYGSQEINMADYVCILEFRTPINTKYKPVVLTPSAELYKEKLEYILDIDTDITSVVGDVQLKLIWVKPEMLADGSFADHVRKTSSISIKVLPVEQWSDYIASSDLDSIAQMVLTTQAQAEQLKMFADYLHMTKADNIKYNDETNELQLISEGVPIGRSVVIDCNATKIETEGIPVVEFGNKQVEELPDDEVNNVVEF